MKNIIAILKSTGAIIENSHLVGTSGRHMPSYINKDALLPYTKYVSEIGKLFALKFKNKNIEVVVSPAVAGIPFSQWTAYHLSKISNREILSAFTEKTPENEQVFKRGYDALVRGKRVLVVEDSTTTGSSVKKVIDSVKKAGGKIIRVILQQADKAGFTEITQSNRSTKSKKLGRQLTKKGTDFLDSIN